MMEKRFYRSRDALLGGVCAGIAEYFNIDPVIVRILAVVLTFATAGTLIVIYLVLWVILPVAPDPEVPVDVQPESVHSETYGQIRYQETRFRNDQHTASHPSSSAVGHTGSGNYARTAHVPPEPPTNYTSPSPESSEEPVSPHFHFVSGHVSASAEPAAGHVSHAGDPGPDVSQNDGDPIAEPASGTVVTGALWFGFLCLFIGVAALLGYFIDGVQWWQFWPLFIVIVGIGQIVIPSRRGERMSQFVGGLMAIFLGGLLLSMSLGVIGYASFLPMLKALWPLLLMMVGFFILGATLKHPLFELCAGLCFVAFCIAGYLWFSIPGATDFITFNLPYRDPLIIDIGLLDDVMHR